MWWTSGVRSRPHSLLYTVDLIPLIQGHGLRPHLYGDDTQVYGSCRPSASLKLQNTITNCATLAGIPLYQLKRLQSVMNAAARLVFSSRKFDYVTPLLCQLHWLKAPERIDYKLAVLVYKCQHGSVPPCLADELCRPADIEGRRCLRSASSSSLIVRRTRLSTVGDRAFPVAMPLVSGTICHSTSRLQNLCLSFAVASSL